MNRTARAPRPAALAGALALAPLAAWAVDGLPDSTFSGDGVVASSFGSGFQAALTVSPLGDGALLAGGIILDSGDSNADLYVIRYRANGSVDGDWGAFGGRRVAIDLVADGWDEALAIVPEANGGSTILGSAGLTALLLRGGTSVSVPALVRLTPEGELDSGFGSGGIEVAETLPWSGSIRTLGASAHSGGYLFFGHCTACAPDETSGHFLYRALADGGGDPAFGSAGWLGLSGASIGQLSAFAVDAAGRIVLAGDHHPQIGTHELRVHRRLASGLPDTDFAGDGTAIFIPEDSLQWSPRAIAVDPVDGAVVVSLSRGAGVEIPAASLLRFSKTGVHDAAFGQPVLAYEEGTFVRAIAVDGLGRIYAGGTIDGFGTQPGGFFFARLLPSGELDDTFDDDGDQKVEVDAVENGWDEGLALALSGGRPVAAGHSETQSGGHRFALVRLTNALIFADGFEGGSTLNW